MFQNQAPAGPPDHAAATMPIPRLAKGQLHEVHASADDWASALFFGLAMAEADAGADADLASATAAQSSRPLLLLRVRKGRVARDFTAMTVPCGEGWSGMGLDPGRLVIVDAADDAGLLRAGLDAAREGGLAAVLLESWGTLRPYDMVASRRLILAAETSCIPIVMLRGDAEPRPSAAHTRWTIASAPSVPLETRAPGPPALLVELTRRRGGPAGMRWRLEWSEQDGAFHDAPLGIDERDGAKETAPPSGAVVPLSSVRTRAPLRRTA